MGARRRCSREARTRCSRWSRRSVSANNRVWTFSPNWDGLDVKNWNKNPKINLLAYFENLNPECIEKAKKASLLFFRYPMPDKSASCLVDRFDHYPL